MTIKTPILVLAIVLLGTLTIRLQTPQGSPVEAAKKSPTPQLLWNVKGIELIGAKVISVESGDTITVRSSGNTYSVRLLAIDAPESGQPIFESSRKALSKLVDKKNVKIVVQAQYSNGVFVGTIYRDGHDVGLKLIEKGMAWFFNRDQDHLPVSMRKSYLEAQTNAASANVGLWAENHPVPPWIYRGDDPSTAVVATKTQLATSPAPMPSANGHKYVQGPRGGCYYVAGSGRRVYAKDKRLCSISTPETKP